jgi:hypothetical protein
MDFILVLIMFSLPAEKDSTVTTIPYASSLTACKEAGEAWVKNVNEKTMGGYSGFYQCLPIHDTIE